ncbi:hypothetical protein AB0I84_36880 [Streptomyces spectabilis]|uniref:hypothetical protein n=1 Tax=Streptomyces spectabilis TaxID=68270 RepID=UPI0033E6A4D5
MRVSPGLRVLPGLTVLTVLTVLADCRVLTGLRVPTGLVVQLFTVARSMSAACLSPYIDGARRTGVGGAALVMRDRRHRLGLEPRDG